MDKCKLNFTIDALMFLCVASLVGMGLMIKFVLIPGKERWVKYGRNVDLLLFGLDRHEWGTIHLIVALVLLGLLVLHIVLHWKMIIAMYERLVTRKRPRRVIALVFLAACAFLITSPLFVRPDVKELKRGEGRHETSQTTENRVGESLDQLGKDVHDVTEESNQHTVSPFIVRGRMTLGEVSYRYSVPIGYLIQQLGIPVGTSSKERLGWLKKRYGFRMGDVERVIQEYYE